MTDCSPRQTGEADSVLTKRVAQIEALGRVAHALTGVEDATRTMELAATEGMRVFEAQRAAVYLNDRETGRFSCPVAIRLSRAYLDAVARNLERMPSVQAVRSGQQHFTVDAWNDASYPLRAEARAEGFVSVAALPLAFGGEYIGSLVFYHDSRREYSREEQVLAGTFADQAALAIGKNRLLDQVTRIKREWQSAFDGTGSGLAIVDSSGRIGRANRFLAEVAGVVVTALPGRNVRSLFPAWPEGPADPLERALASGQRESIRLPGADGRHFALAAIPRADGGLVVAVDDLTELVRLEERFTRVVQTAEDAIVITGLDGRITFANRAAVGLFGWPLARILGTGLDAILTPESPAADAGASGSGGRSSCTLRREDGLRFLAVSSAPLEERGTLTGTVSVIRDMTPDRLAAEAVRRSEARFRALFAAVPLAAFTVREDRQLQSVNEAAFRMVGLPLRPSGYHVSEILPAAETEAVAAHLAASFAGETREFSLHFVRRDGARRDAVAVSVPVEDPGTQRVILVIVRDVTDEVQLRERLTQSEKMAALGQLVSGVAHELNNPLAGIAALAQSLALDPDADEETAGLGGAIQREAVRAGRIVSDLLTFARQRPLRRSSTDLNAVVRAVLESLRAQNGQVEWELALADDLPAVNADCEQLQQVVTNLVVNAIQAMEASPARVCRIRTYWTPEVVGCEVSDTGSGIAPDALQRIFEPFFTTKRAGAGTGLGLSISHGIIRAHGGEIRARNRAGGGATVWFELPRSVTGRPRESDA